MIALLILSGLSLASLLFFIAALRLGAIYDENDLKVIERGES
ncbi:hypothetical protein [Larsenimonas suaedae]|uniref:Cbb3-type cytochrome oxidase assembly protein CcoS n=1 Tax=Larsenimonas suaedae TaxID=1851019 RepID=A0ABU1GZ79_9GAMM|nr:hypothetical protein [Larsenimonas suaedae]MDR5897356.1 hypothetical protein [Larsenimonas suaedae]